MVHFILEVSLHFLPELIKPECFLTKFMKTCLSYRMLYRVEFTHFLSHRVVSQLDNSLCNLSVSDHFFNFLNSHVFNIISVLDEVCQSSKYMVVTDNFAQFWEMPTKPLSDAHRECIDVFVQEIQETNRLDDWLVFSINVQGNFIS